MRRWTNQQTVTNCTVLHCFAMYSVSYSWDNSMALLTILHPEWQLPQCSFTLVGHWFLVTSLWSGTGQEAFIGLEQVATCSDTGMALLPNISYGSTSYHAIAVLIVAIGQNWHSKWAIPLDHEICLDFSMEFSRDWSHYKIRIFLCDNPIS